MQAKNCHFVMCLIVTLLLSGCYLFWSNDYRGLYKPHRSSHVVPWPRGATEGFITSKEPDGTGQLGLGSRDTR